MNLVNYLFIFTIYICRSSIILTTSQQSLDKKEQLRNYKFPPCQSCKQLVLSFQKGMESTSRGKFEGGDADWEEKKLRTYNNSEIRLVEIEEKMCNNLEKGQEQCFKLFSTNELLFEEWWINLQSKRPDLFEWLCIEQLKMCCPENHYGPECTQCEGYPDNVCSSNGKCKGSGTRKGNGKCTCNDGYEGDKCTLCTKGYYTAYKDDTKVLCEKCHVACKDGCTGPATKGCVACEVGWVKLDQGCLDLNECLTDPCESSEFCVNTQGSYNCVTCDKACKSCTGDGPDMCKECQDDYMLKDGMCVDETDKKRKEYVKLTRYITYLGLCVTAGIIFQRNVILAGIIGIAITFYIAIAEYMLNDKTDEENLTDQLKQYLLKIFQNQ